MPICMTTEKRQFLPRTKIKQELPPMKPHSGPTNRKDSQRFPSLCGLYLFLFRHWKCSEHGPHMSLVRSLILVIHDNVIIDTNHIV
jgi:hypothetical protein